MTTQDQQQLEAERKAITERIAAAPEDSLERDRLQREFGERLSHLNVRLEAAPTPKAPPPK